MLGPRTVIDVLEVTNSSRYRIIVKFGPPAAASQDELWRARNALAKLKASPGPAKAAAAVEEHSISDSGKVILFRATKPYWLVDASLGAESGLSVCSGDASNEWFLRVEPEHIDRLLFALRARKERLGIADATMAYGDPVPDNEVLRLLFETFGNASSNPYTDVKEFFTESDIRFTSDFWGSM